MGFVTIRTYPNPALAHLDKGLLEQQGIIAVVENEGVIGSDGLLSGAVGGIQVSVPEKDLAKARAVLAVPAPLDDGEGDAFHRCPQCRSTMISNYGPYVWTILLGPLTFPLWFIRRTMCHSCGHRWKREPAPKPKAKLPVTGALHPSAIREAMTANPYATPHGPGGPEDAATAAREDAAAAVDGAVAGGGPAPASAPVAGSAAAPMGRQAEPPTAP
jgi:hypothetical protein